MVCVNFVFFSLSRLNIGESESRWNSFRLTKWERFVSKAYLSSSNVGRIILRISRLGDYAIRVIILRLVSRLPLSLSPSFAAPRNEKAKFCVSNHVKDIFHWYFKYSVSAIGKWTMNYYKRATIHIFFVCLSKSTQIWKITWLVGIMWIYMILL